MAKYKLSTDGIRDTETGKDIPNNEANKDWREYQAWLAEDPENNIPDPQYTEEEIEEQEKVKEKESKIAELKVDESAIYTFASELYVIGEAAGLWSIDDFSEDMQAILNQWGAITGELKNKKALKSG